jgi:hypothetical protein
VALELGEAEEDARMARAMIDAPPGVAAKFPKLEQS